MKKLFIILLCITLVVFAVAGAAYGVHKYQTSKAADTAETTEYSEEATTNTVTPDAVAEPDYGISDSDPLKDLKLSLIVDLDRQMLDEMYTGYLKDFLDSSMPINNDERTSAASKVGWGKEGQKMYDAVTFPFSTVAKDKKDYSKEDIEKMYGELKEEIMRNPVMGDMVLQGMAYMALTDGTTVKDLNDDWVKDFLAIYDEKGCGAFVTYHTRYWERYGIELPHDGEDVDQWRADHPNAPEPTQADLELIPVDDTSVPTPDSSIAGSYGRQGLVAESRTGNKLFVTDYYVDSAKRILAWLDRCTIEGVETYATSVHWPLNSTENANKVRTYRNEDKDYIDKQPALIFSVKVKDSSKQILFGFNIYDMRLEIFERTATPVKADPEPKPQPKPSPSPNPTPNPTPVPVPTPTPTPTPNPTPTPDPTPPGPTPTPTPQKDPKDDPVHQGNAPKGGGEGQGDTPAQPVSDPSKQDMQDAGGGEDHNQGHSDPETVQPSTPDPAPSAPESQHTDEQKQDYGEEDHSQHDSVTDDGGHTSNPDDQDSGGDFSEPGV